jgi:spore germination protein KA
MSLLLPGLYVAITNFHHEMIPTDLLLAIEASRERVPFPSVIEILIMEFAFELIREAGIRIPGPIGPTLGIIGALILGQAAVAANIVSPILIIIVAVTGIGSFAIPNFGLGYAFRILRFAYILLGATAGFLGITFGLFVHGIWLASSKSFGVPFLAPFGPKTKSGLADQFLRSPIWRQEERPDYLNVKDAKKQPEISREWSHHDKIK